MGIFEKLGLREVINAGGRFTAIGGSLLDQRVAKAMAEASQSFVVVEDLKKRAGEIISKITGAEAAWVTSGAAAGIVIGTAACIAGKDLAKVYRLPDSEDMKNEVIIQRGHIINFGAPITQMMRLGGAKVVEVGFSNLTRIEQLEGSINEKTAAIMYVVSHHCVQKGMLPLEDVVKNAKKYDVPLIVDAAAEFDLKKYIATGADLVTYSGGKEFCGPACAGFICGRRDLIEACAMQENGVARCMKVSKEVIAGLITALEIYVDKDLQAVLSTQKEKVEYIVDELKDIPDIKVNLVEDETERPIIRAQIALDERSLGMTAYDVINELGRGDPIIIVRSHYANLGVLLIDPRSLKNGQEKIVANRLRKILAR